MMKASNTMPKPPATTIAALNEVMKIVNGLPPDWTLLGISAAGTLVALVLCYRYFLRLGILDGWNGFVFHFLQAFWFRLITDVRIEELRRGSSS